MPTLRYESLAIVTQVLAKLHTGGGTYKFSTDQSEIEAHPVDPLNRRHALILQTVPVKHPVTGSDVQHLPNDSLPLSRGIKMPGVLFAESPNAGLQQIGRTMVDVGGRLRRAGIIPIEVPLVGASVVGDRVLDRSGRGRTLGYGWLIDADESMHAAQSHVISVGGVTHTIDLSMGAGGMVSQWTTEDPGVISLDQQHLNMGGGTVAAMGFQRGIQSGARARHSDSAALAYTLNPRQGGDVFSPSMAGAWHTPPPTAAHVLLAGGSPVIRARKWVAGNGTTTIDITTVPLDLDPDGRYWSYLLGVTPKTSMFAGAGYGKPAAVFGCLMHTRWTFGWNGFAHIHRCDVWYDLGVDFGDDQTCQMIPEFTPCEIHLRSGATIHESCFVYDGAAQLRTALHSSPLWPGVGLTRDLVVTADGAAARDPHEVALPAALRTGRGGVYFMSGNDGSCIGLFAHAPQFGRIGKPWGFQVTPWNYQAVSKPDRLVDPHHRFSVVSGGTDPRTGLGAPASPAGVLGPITTFVLTGSQSVLEANMRMLAAYREEELHAGPSDPFAL